MTLNDLVIRVKTRTHRGKILTTTDDITQQIVDAVNDTRRETIRFIPKDWLRSSTTITTSNGVSTYDLPLDCLEPLLFRYTINGADYILTKIESEKDFYNKVYSSLTAFNKPYFYIDLGVNSATRCRRVQLFPTPDAAYSIVVPYMMDITLTDLTIADLSTDLPVFPSYVQDILWKGAKWHFLENFDDPNRVGAEKEYKECQDAIDIADEANLDGKQAMRMDSGHDEFRSPGTDIRLR